LPTSTDGAALWPERPELDSPGLAELCPETARDLRALARWLAVEAGPGGHVDSLPAANLDALARGRLYGAMAAVAEGGLGLGRAELCTVVEELAAGCVTTTFVWAQHLRLLAAVLDPTTPGHLRAELRDRAVSGVAKGGVVLTGLMPGPVRLSARPVAGGWLLEGEAPWVSGWGLVDVLVVVARSLDGSIVELLVDAATQLGLHVGTARLSALNATATVSLRFAGLFVPDERLLSRHPLEAEEPDAGRLRLNGSFALGLAKRCCALLGPSPLDDQLRQCRERLDCAARDAHDARPAGDRMAAARAGACELAARAAHRVVVDRGSRAALAGDLGERLSREASVLLVFGSRPAIKGALLGLLGLAPAGG